MWLRKSLGRAECDFGRVFTSQNTHYAFTSLKWKYNLV